MRTIIVGFAVWLLAGLAITLSLSSGRADLSSGRTDAHEGRADLSSGRTDAREGGLIPPVSACNPEAFGGFNWRWVGCNHENHLHAQWRHGRGTPGHTVHAYRREAREFRAWLHGLAA